MIDRGKPSGVEIDRGTRDALWASLVLDLGAVDGLWMQLSEGGRGVHQAQRDRRRFEENCRLLDDLDWPQEVQAQSFTLTLPPAPLATILRRLSGEAVEEIGEWSDRPDETPDQRETAAEYRDQLLDLRSACAAIVGRLEGATTDERGRA